MYFQLLKVLWIKRRRQTKSRPKDYRKPERRKEKIEKQKSWANKDGSLAPIIVPATPDGALAKILSDVVENESKSGMKFKIVERGGISVGKMLQKPNPTQFYCLYE